MRRVATGCASRTTRAVGLLITSYGRGADRIVILTHYPPSWSGDILGDGMSYEWRGEFDSAEVEALHAEGFGHKAVDYDWRGQVERHSLGWVCARDGGDLVGFVNVPWDGATHAFILDTLVAGRARRPGIGTRLVELAATEARAAGCEWLHVDFDDELGTLLLSTLAASSRRRRA